MKGSTLVGTLMLAALGMGTGLWYTIEKAYYVGVTDIKEISVSGVNRPVKNYMGIDADTSPLKMRACFKVDWDYLVTDEFRNFATPLIAPKSFDCFDAKKIDTDLKTGSATAILANENIPFGFNTFIAQYPNGQAFMWRQVNTCGNAHFRGDPLPEGCPIPEDAVAKNLMRDPKSPLHTINLMLIIDNKLEEISIDGSPITAYSTDAKFYYSCFKTLLNFELLAEKYQASLDPLPSKPLGNMNCYDHEQILNDIKSGLALSFISEKNIINGIDRIIAVYSDGRAFAWHQRAK